MAEIRVTEPLTLSWDEICVVANSHVDLLDKIRGKRPKKTTILEGVSGVIEPGTLTALMGPSGAGKTTLMNVLTQRNLHGLEIDGTVMLNGVPINKISSYSKMVGFIQQFDLLPGALTVREHLNFTVSLLYQKSMTPKARQAKVEAVITQVSLRKCADTLIGGQTTSERVSGGERKRVSIATQLLNNPSVIILDEPTTGMDSYLAHLLLKILKDLASRGYTILCTLHQPSSEGFIQFDRLALIADGRMAYSGSRVGAVDYFGRLGFQCPITFSPADYFIDILTRKPGQEDRTSKDIQFLCDQFEQSPEADTITTKLDTEVSQGKAGNAKFAASKKQMKMFEASILTQFLLLLKRELRGLVRLPNRLVAQTAAMLLTSMVMLSILWNPDTPVNQRFVTNSFAGVSLIGTFCGGLTLVGMLGNMIENMPLVVKEYRDGMYRAPLWYAASILIEIVVAILLFYVVFFPYYYGSGLYKAQQSFSAPLEMMLVGALLTLGTLGFAAIMIFLGETTEVAVELFASVMNTFSFLNGFFVNLRSIENPIVKALCYFNWLPWSIEWMQNIQWKGVEIECEYEGTDKEDTCLTTGEQAVYKLGFEDNKTKDSLILVGQICLYHGIALFLMLYKMKRKFAG